MTEEEDQPHYRGHRKRLRKKFRESGREALHDYELLELLLTYALPRGDVKPLAKELLKQFGSLQNILEADHKELLAVEGIGKVSATFFSLLKAASAEYLAEKMEGEDVLSNPEAVADFARLKIGDEDREVFMAIYVDKSNKVIDLEILSEGTVDRADIYPREIVKSAIEHNATGLILVHNHPSGKLEPSDSDRRITDPIKDVSASLDIRLLDHLIVTGTDSMSLLDRS